MTVTYVTSGGTAISGTDYTSANGVATVTAGTTSTTIVITTTDDTLDENNGENFVIVLSSPSNATLGTSIGTGTIDDNDTTAISINDVSENEGDPLTFTVTLSLTSVNTVTIDVATTNGTALAGSDYVTTGRTLTFSPGVTSRTMTVLGLEDITNEPNELFSVVLSNPSNAAISDNTGQGTVVDDDGVPTLNVEDT